MSVRSSWDRRLGHGAAAAKEPRAKQAYPNDHVAWPIRAKDLAHRAQNELSTIQQKSEASEGEPEATPLGQLNERPGKALDSQSPAERFDACVVSTG